MKRFEPRIGTSVSQNRTRTTIRHPGDAGGFRSSWKRLWGCQMMRVIEATVMERGFQLVRDCLDTDQAPFEPRDSGGLPEAPH